MARPPRELIETNLRREAAARGYSLVFVASRAGLTTVQLLAIFSGEYDPDVDVLINLASAVGCRLSDLFHDPTSLN